MIRLLTLVMLLITVSGCYLPTFPEKPKLISNTTHPLSTKPKTDAVLLWLPQTKRPDVISYRLAVEQNLESLLVQHALLQRSKAAQQVFELAIEKNGGFYDTSSGRLNRQGLSLALEQVNRYIAAEMPTVTDIIYMNFKQQNIRVQDGIARWDNVQQKLNSPGCSVRHYNAISLEINYVLHDDQKLTEYLGLDVEPAPIGPHQRYDLILQRLLQPYL